MINSAASLLTIYLPILNNVTMSRNDKEIYISREGSVRVDQKGIPFWSTLTVNTWTCLLALMYWLLLFLSCAVPSGRPERRADVLHISRQLQRSGLKEACQCVSLSCHHHMYLSRSYPGWATSLPLCIACRGTCSREARAVLPMLTALRRRQCSRTQ